MLNWHRHKQRPNPILANGSATFAGAKFNIYASGETFIDSPAQNANSKVFRINADVPTVAGEIVAINANGQATFKGQVNAGNTNDSQRYAMFGLTNQTGDTGAATFFAKNTAAFADSSYCFIARGNSDVNQITLSNNPATFAGNITAGNVTFNTGVDDPANFDSEGVYTGPTLAVKDKLTDIIDAFTLKQQPLLLTTLNLRQQLLCFG